MKSRIFKNKRDLIEKLIFSTDVVLDVGFWGQGTPSSDSNWVHSLLKKQAKDVYGVDVSFDENTVTPVDHYVKKNAEDFSFDIRFDVIFAGDLIEHLSNPGLFLNVVKQHLKTKGRIIFTTPNAFNLFNIAEKISKGEPTVNHDHAFYLNPKTIKQLLEKNGMEIRSMDYVYSLETHHRESFKKKILNIFYFALSKFTPLYIETMAVVAVKSGE